MYGCMGCALSRSEEAIHVGEHDRCAARIVQRGCAGAGRSRHTACGHEASLSGWECPPCSCSQCSPDFTRTPSDTLPPAPPGSESSHRLTLSLSGGPEEQPTYCCPLGLCPQGSLCPRCRDTAPLGLDSSHRSDRGPCTPGRGGGVTLPVRNAHRPLGHKGLGRGLWGAGGGLPPRSEWDQQGRGLRLCSKTPNRPGPRS